jgi:hypothetical protein
MSDDYSTDTPSLGPCCNCGTTENVRNIVMLARRAPTPGSGWGCVVCGLPSDGAVAVMCDDCLEQEPRAVCDGYPVAGKRVPIEQLAAEAFDHRPDVEH